MLSAGVRAPYLEVSPSASAAFDTVSRHHLPYVLMAVTQQEPVHMANRQDHASLMSHSPATLVPAVGTAGHLQWFQGFQGIILGDRLRL